MIRIRDGRAAQHPGSMFVAVLNVIINQNETNALVANKLAPTKLLGRPHSHP
jgi:hypothetical protein